VVLAMRSGDPMSICEAANEARRDRKRWGNPATIEVHTDDESALCACTDAVTGRNYFFKSLFLVDSYDEAYLRAMALDFKSTSITAL